MRRHGALTRIVILGLPLVFAPELALGQVGHLAALRDWMQHMEESDKCLDRGDYRKAEERINVAIKEIRPFLPETRRVMARSYCQLARVLYHQKRYAEAEPLARWALLVRDSEKGVSPEAVFQCVYTLALIQAAQKKHGEAEQLFQRSLELQEQNLGRDHINSVVVLNQLAAVYVQEASYAKAEPVYRRLIAIHERKSADANLELADTADKYSALLKLMKRNDDATTWQVRAATIRDAALSKAAKSKADRPAPQFSGYK